MVGFFATELFAIDAGFGVTCPIVAAGVVLGLLGPVLASVPAVRRATRLPVRVALERSSLSARDRAGSSTTDPAVIDRTTTRLEDTLTAHGYEVGSEITYVGARDIRRIFATEGVALALALAGWVVAIPLGYAIDLLVWLLKEVLEVDVPVAYPAGHVALALAGTIVIALLVMAIPLRRCGGAGARGRIAPRVIASEGRRPSRSRDRVQRALTSPGHRTPVGVVCAYCYEVRRHTKCSYAMA